MIFKQRFLQGIAAGRISLAFRRWKRPTVKAGGQLRTAIGVLAIDSVEEIDEAQITLREAVLAGYPSREALVAELRARSGTLYRIALRYSGADPREDLRQQAKLSKQELDEMQERLARMDARSRRGSWTMATLRLIAENPGRRAPDLAEQFGADTKWFKTHVRKLKELGLTESLKVGYRLSPRGQFVFKRLGPGSN